MTTTLSPGRLVRVVAQTMVANVAIDESIPNPDCSFVLSIAEWDSTTSADEASQVVEETQLLNYHQVAGTYKVSVFMEL